VPTNLPQKIVEQIRKAGLPTTGQHPFQPRLVRNRRGQAEIQKTVVKKGPKKGKRGYVDDQDRIWIKDRAHSGLPDHWDVQLNDGDDYLRVDMQGDEVL
jgi:hypothetical protein